MIGSAVLRTAHYILGVAAEDRVSAGEEPAHWLSAVVLLGDGMRLEAKGALFEDEMPELGRQLTDLLEGRRTAASVASRDGSLYLFFDRRSDREVGVAFRILRDRERRLISVGETITTRAEAESFAAAAKRFPLS